MKILICLSHVPDTTTKVKFVDNNTQLDKTGIQWIINPWDELALTRALELKDDASASIESVTVITVGGKDTEPTIRKALAIGADDALRVDTFPGDAYVVASEVAEAIRSRGYDIIICGIESSDYNNSLVGGMLAELLNIPSVSAVSGLHISNGHVTLNREIDGGKEVVSVPMPFVAIVQKGIAIEPRIASMRGIMMAKKKTIDVIAPANVNALTEYANYELPQPKAACKMIDPENVKELVDLLHNEAKVI
ncbi:MAG: electron transfer flavoprotein subunit beta/FixA family protein [Bacteroidales bacterium]|nr:electron transfer flavoprotein subunit beta/FixA family protein [Bacteroidales bacterium]